MWDLNPCPFGPEPKSSALDHLTKLSKSLAHAFVKFTSEITNQIC